jgi:DNA-binding Xre family transcriptional regulator
MGSRFDDWLEDEGIREEVEAAAVKRVIAWQLDKAMREAGVTKTEMARRMKTSRAVVNCLLNADNTAVTLGTITKAGAALGLHLNLSLERHPPAA